MLYKAEFVVWVLIGVFESLLIFASAESLWRYAFASFALMLSVLSFYAWKVDLLQRARELAATSGGVKMQWMIVFSFTQTNDEDEEVVTPVWPTTFEVVRLVCSCISVATTAVVFAMLIRGYRSIPRLTIFPAGVTTVTLVTIALDSFTRAFC